MYVTLQFCIINKRSALWTTIYGHTNWISAMMSLIINSRWYKQDYSRVKTLRFQFVLLTSTAKLSFHLCIQLSCILLCLLSWVPERHWIELLIVDLLWKSSSSLVKESWENPHFNFNFQESDVLPLAWQKYIEYACGFPTVCQGGMITVQSWSGTNDRDANMQSIVFYILGIIQTFSREGIDVNQWSNPRLLWFLKFPIQHS